MKTSYAFALSIISYTFLVPTISFAQTVSKPVDWIHGMGGSSTSLEEVATHYQSLRPILSPTRHTFVTNSGAIAMSNSVQSTTGGANRIAISHSMGGVAVRQVDIWNSSHWSGIVTMGSPLRGAQVANSATNGTGTAYINNAMNQLMRGPQAGATHAPLVAAFGLLIQAAGILGEIFSVNIAQKATDAIMNSIGLVGQTRDDLSTGSAYMTGVASASTATPKIFIWGSENDPLFWRTIGSMAESTDDAGVSLRNHARNQYTTIADQEYALRFINLPLYALHNHRGNEWSAGRDWINYESNDGWAKVIGASYSVTQQVPVLRDRCGPEGFDDCMSNPSHSTAYCMDLCTETIMETRTYHYNDPSDGVVPAPSQRNSGGGWTGYALEAPGVNHREMRKQANISPTLDWVLNGGYRSDIFQIKY